MLTAAGNRNGSNVCVKNYNGSSYQIWACSALSNPAPKKDTGSTASSSVKKVNYLQWDSRWGSYKFGKVVGKYDYRDTITNSGCCILSHVNAVYNLTGKFIQPTELAKLAADKGYYNCDSYGGCPASENISKLVEQKYGASYGFKYTGHGQAITETKLINHLKSGGTAVVNVYNHYIAIVGYDANTKKYQVFDCAPGAKYGRSATAAGTNTWLKANQFTGMLRVTNGYWMYAKK